MSSAARLPLSLAALVAVGICACAQQQVAPRASSAATVCYQVGSGEPAAEDPATEVDEVVCCQVETGGAATGPYHPAVAGVTYSPESASRPAPTATAAANQPGPCFSPVQRAALPQVPVARAGTSAGTTATGGISFALSGQAFSTRSGENQAHATLPFKTSVRRRDDSERASPRLVVPTRSPAGPVHDNPALRSLPLSSSVRPPLAAQNEREDEP